jgi:ferredoxin
MTTPVYEQLAEAFSSRGGSLAVLKRRELYALLEELFTQEEAELAAKMPLSPMPAADLATGMGGDPQGVEKLLETMADKGLVFTYERGGVRHYNLMALFPGIFEMQFMKGEVSDRAKKIARLFQDYSSVMLGLREGTAPAIPTFPFARVITVEQEIPAGVEIYPHDKASEYIANSDQIAVGTCYCRHWGELLDRPCDKPKDVCLSFGPTAKFIAERGFGRLISKEEALKVLDRAEKAGLVHCSSNTGKYVDFICNCCICHCLILQSIRSAVLPNRAATSGFIMVVDEEQCTGCGDCIGRCPMEALSMQDDIVVRDADRCIGCGLCISVCPTSALRMELREQRPIPLRDRRELNIAVMASMPRNEAMPDKEERK